MKYGKKVIVICQLKVVSLKNTSMIYGTQNQTQKMIAVIDTAAVSPDDKTMTMRADDDGISLMCKQSVLFSCIGKWQGKGRIRQPFSGLASIKKSGQAFWPSFGLVGSSEAEEKVKILLKVSFEFQKTSFLAFLAFVK